VVKFSKPVFRHVQLLVMGAVLAPGKHTVSAVLRIVGLKAENNFHKYHRVLSLVEWSALEAGRILLKLLLACFLPAGPVVVGIDETLERRWGRRIAQRGIYRDSVRSSGSHFVKSSGLRWMSVEPIFVVEVHAFGTNKLGQESMGTALSDRTGS
jgi:hypothetical protein